MSRARQNRQILEAHQVACYEPALAQDDELALPQEHRDFLSITDGATGYGGYFRLFGVGGAVAGIHHWNDERVWKFAWPRWVSDFLMFGETAWGDQYAYLKADLLISRRPNVYFMESITLAPEIISAGFGDFLEGEFLRNCVAPYDEQIVAVRQRLGDLKVGDHIVYQPSPLLGGGESPDSVSQLPAVASMIVNGDLASQLAEASGLRELAGLDPYIDSQGRMRMRARWAT